LKTTFRRMNRVPRRRGRWRLHWYLPGSCPR